MEFTSKIFVEIAGWIPAIIFPAATLIQLLKIIHEKSALGVSILSWALFGIANLGFYIYAEKYFALQSIIGFLGTAILDFIIVGLSISLNTKKEPA